MTVYLASYAWTSGRLARNVRIEVRDGVITKVTPDSAGSRVVSDGLVGDSADLPAVSAPDSAHAGREASAVRLSGLVVPGFANAHSHAFHRALRGRTHAGGGSFWTWRDLMYSVAGRLDPDSYYALARGVYAEMALAGITAVGEFHYLHHGRDGVPYDDPNAMGRALVQAAADAGIRITLLDTLYLTATVDGKPLEGVQRRFGDGDLDGWSERVAGLRSSPHARIGAALHSVRAVPASEMTLFADRTAGLPVHVHLSEQRAENEQTLAAYGCTPAELLERNGVWREDTVAVHATHLTDRDIDILSGHHVCFCPTTERDLADGIGPARRLAEAGAKLSLGSDSHAVIDQFEELRGLEMNDRLASEQRGRFTPAELIAAATNHGAIGWPDAGEIAVGRRADFVCVRLDSVRTAGADPAQAILAATAADITHVIADGRVIVADGRHQTIDVPRALAETIAELTDERSAQDSTTNAQRGGRLAQNDTERADDDRRLAQNDTERADDGGCLAQNDTERANDGGRLAQSVTSHAEDGRA